MLLVWTVLQLLFDHSKVYLLRTNPRWGFFLLVQILTHGWLRDRGLLANLTGGRWSTCGNGNINMRMDKSYSKDHFVWRCTNKKCNKLSIRHSSWFRNSHLSIEQIIKMTYYWVWKLLEYFVQLQLNIGSPETLVDWYNYCREVCLCSLEDCLEQIGGNNIIVEIDESKFGKRKYNRGKRVEGQWVFGGIEKENKEKCFMVCVQERSAATLIPIIYCSRLHNHFWLLESILPVATIRGIKL